MLNDVQRPAFPPYNYDTIVDRVAQPKSFGTTRWPWGRR
ncbi:hypothetical protein BofuT4_uP086230.1 [Botrytis cinerea T4]|uniref:Uncharacterized protein n=1 Tax=Botryotinia fuckeliana (strain T4) TaxID=999810 RepID=G2YGE6_BOTF4|nr:hypothetical protein BofuT4_uP086230.1 [Botrytis cinerea T4]